MTATDTQGRESRGHEERKVSLRDVPDRYRRPEYVGENRCFPCTILNVLIAGLLATVAGLIALEVGFIVFVLFLLVIYLRGYLVPYTPSLKKRYFPNWILRHVDHHDRQHSQDTSAVGFHVDPERILRDAGAIEPCDSGHDLCLTPAFERAVYSTIGELRAEEAERNVLAPLLDVDPETLEFVEYGDAFAAFVDDRKAGQWESRAAFQADIAFAGVLSDRLPEWGELASAERGRILGALRVFLTECPSCGGSVSFGRDLVESCCRDIEVVAVTCEGCGTRLFEREAQLLDL